MMPSVILGDDSQTGKELRIGDIERRSGFYILGKPGMGKSSLMVFMAMQDLYNAHKIFFLDPHGDAISDFSKRIYGIYDGRTIVVSLFDPADREYAFGINLLSCNDPTDLTAIMETYTRAFNVFQKLWEDSWGVWLQLILQNTLMAFIENQEYTLAEIPLFLNPRNTEFRNYILSNVKLNLACVDFWRYEFFQRRERDQQERVDAALTRINTLLTHPYVRHIIGQKESTIAFPYWLSDPDCTVLLFKLSVNLPEDVKKFIGTIIMSELLHAVRTRPEGQRDQFCIYVDEFQNFASSDDMRTLITEGRKFGSAITFAHQERFGQFADNQKLMGATLAAANKVVFQSTVPDAKELALEFAQAPPVAETRLEPELVISTEPFWDLLKRGHTNPQISAYIKKYIWQIQEHIDRQKGAMEAIQIRRDASQANAQLYRDYTSLSQADEREEGRYNAMTRGRAVSGAYGAIDRTRSAIEMTKNAHLEVEEHNFDLMDCSDHLRRARAGIDIFNKFVYQIMTGDTTCTVGSNLFCEAMMKQSILYMNMYSFGFESTTVGMYTRLMYADPKEPLGVPAYLAVHVWPESIEKLYLAKQRVRCEEAYRREFARAQDHCKRTNLPIPHIQTVEERLQKDLQGYRQSKIYLRGIIETSYIIIPITRSKNLIFPDAPSTREDNVPDMPERVITPAEREALKQACLKHMSTTWGQTHVHNLLQTHNDFIDFCALLQKPENHIKIASGQYVEKKVYVRPVHDMSDEMAQELTNLPRFHAYAKILTEKDGEQTVSINKMQTYMLPDALSTADEDTQLIISNGHDLSKRRSEVEEEIHLRQEKWRIIPPPTDSPDEPPPPIRF